MFSSIIFLAPLRQRLVAAECCWLRAFFFPTCIYIPVFLVGLWREFKEDAETNCSLLLLFFCKHFKSIAVFCIYKKSKGFRTGLSIGRGDWDVLVQCSTAGCMCTWGGVSVGFRLSVSFNKKCWRKTLACSNQATTERHTRWMELTACRPGAADMWRGGWKFLDVRCGKNTLNIRFFAILFRKIFWIFALSLSLSSGQPKRSDGCSEYSSPFAFLF